ncbi:molybdopterin-guanine dinucleotide biosynthesis adapter protein MobB [Gottschalkia purinilytica]|uniref:Molybdopterin-guanine dinucleotide biosynthesis adapter protein MobB n=1 Tax=Gottschalkia purinilytica TaxID=1503 RepID=A0A0L0WB52_GOTPU|nr:molybdopterin-guanine dinucleotide biosynthesis protein B [Gottschalkia purinilytica]KNF08759.1 molybdopterin-guanine dinucleotide biosynthesis adapter protein MobB [Gottschalkia purinilytica]
MIPVISIVGFSNSGKTTLIVKILKEIKLRGYRVAIIKHHHGDFDIDEKGKDSWHHSQAGADTVIVSSPNKFAMVSNLEEEKELDDLIKLIGDVDLIITEGYKKLNKPKIAVFRTELCEHDSILELENLIAVASDTYIKHKVPCFDLEDIEGLVNLIEKKFLKNK